MYPSLYHGKHLTSATEFDLILLQEVFKSVRAMKELSAHVRHRAALRHFLIKDGEPAFFHIFSADPSARTITFFEHAIRNLGGQSTKETLIFSDVLPGETHRSIARLFGPHCAGMIVRDTHTEHAARLMADAVEDYHLPTIIINAGTGKTEHPVQMLTDLYTISEYKRQEFESGQLTIALVGDITGSRAIRSLLIGLNNFGGMAYLIDPSNQIMPRFIQDPKPVPDLAIDRMRISLISEEGALDIANKVDVWYFTQASPSFSYYRIIKEYLKRMKEDAIIMHPLPYGDEYENRIDLRDKRFIHYPQADNGLFVGMALLKLLFLPHIDLHLVLMEQEYIEMSGMLKSVPIKIKQISAVCAQDHCGQVRTDFGWASVDLELKNRLFSKPKVSCPNCRPL